MFKNLLLTFFLLLSVSSFAQQEENKTKEFKIKAILLCNAGERYSQR